IRPVSIAYPADSSRCCCIVRTQKVSWVVATIRANDVRPGRKQRLDEIPWSVVIASRNVHPRRRGNRILSLYYSKSTPYSGQTRWEGLGSNPQERSDPRESSDRAEPHRVRDVESSLHLTCPQLQQDSLRPTDRCRSRWDVRHHEWAEATASRARGQAGVA